jgi:flagellin
MTGIVLSASVRQNLLSLQSTASLLATTQNDLSTGNKVNSALDNPTSYFTAAALNNRASDINNLLDGIGNGVQVLQAANTGITSLQSLVASAQSVANQVLQTPIGYSAKSSVSTAAITGATANNLLGTGTGYTDATFAGAPASGTTTAAYTTTSATGTVALQDNTSTAVIGTTSLDSTATTHLASSVLTALSGKTLTLNGNTITFSASATSTTTSGSNTTVGLGAGTSSTVGDILTALQTAGGTGVTASVNGTGNIALATGTTNNITFGSTANDTAVLAALGISSQTRGGGATAQVTLTGATLLSGTATAGGGALSTPFAAGNTITVDGKTLTFEASGASGANQINVTDTVTTLLSKIDGLSGGTGSAVTAGALNLHTGTTNGTLSITSSNAAALAALGLGTGVSQAAGGSSLPLSGKVLTIGATGGGTATNITFGTAAGDVSTLNQLNAALASNNLQATIDSTGVITVTTSNNAASSTVGAIGGSAAGAGYAFSGLVATGPVADPNAQATRAGLITQYNNILKQIATTSQDSSFNGINLLQGDTLNLTFDETGKSTLAIQGATFNTAGLGLSTLTAGTDFLDGNSANAVLTSLSAASSTLRSEASSLGSNLSIVQVRQDFSKNLINVLQTGASNLTLADTNEEAANSQALSTRQSIAVSALALANTSQQSVLQLLR